MPISALLTYLIVFLLPAVFLYILATFIMTRSAYVLKGKLIAGILYSGAIGFTVEFIRNISPMEYAHFSHIFGVLLPMHIAFALTVHTSYILVRPIKKIRIPFAPWVFYSFPILISCIGIIETLLIETPSYTKHGIWLLRDDTGLLHLNIFISFLFCCLNMYILNTGRASAKTKNYANIFTILLVTTFVCLIGLIAEFILFDYINLPSTNGLLAVLYFGIIVTFLMLRHDFLISSAKRYTIMMETSPVPIITLNHRKKIIEANDVAIQQFNLQVGTNFEKQLASKQHETLFNDLKTERKVKNYSLQFTNSDGQNRLLSLDASAIQVVESDYYFIMLRDITAEREQEELNNYLAYHDHLTGSHNRTFFLDNVTAALQNHKHNQLGAFVLTDVNYFKLINDQYGHLTGDHVLIHVANIFKEHMPDPKIFARLGGDEFVLFYETIHSQAQFEKVIDELRDVFKSNPYRTDFSKIDIEVSFGIAYVGLDSLDYDELYHIADMRMYEDKQRIKQQDYSF